MSKLTEWQLNLIRGLALERMDSSKVDGFIDFVSSVSEMAAGDDKDSQYVSNQSEIDDVVSQMSVNARLERIVATLDELVEGDK